MAHAEHSQQVAVPKRISTRWPAILITIVLIAFLLSFGTLIVLNITSSSENVMQDTPVKTVPAVTPLAEDAEPSQTWPPQPPKMPTDIQRQWEVAVLPVPPGWGQPFLPTMGVIHVGKDGETVYGFHHTGAISAFVWQSRDWGASWKYLGRGSWQETSQEWAVEDMRIPHPFPQEFRATFMGHLGWIDNSATGPATITNAIYGEDVYHTPGLNHLRLGNVVYAKDPLSLKRVEVVASVNLDSVNVKLFLTLDGRETWYKIHTSELTSQTTTFLNIASVAVHRREDGTVLLFAGDHGKTWRAVLPLELLDKSPSQ